MSVPNKFCDDCGAQVQTVNVEIRNSQTEGEEGLTVMQGVCIVCRKAVTFGACIEPYTQDLIPKVKFTFVISEATKQRIKKLPREVQLGAHLRAAMDKILDDIEKQKSGAMRYKQ